MFSGFFSYTTPRKEGVAVEKRMARESDQDSDVGDDKVEDLVDFFDKLEMSTSESAPQSVSGPAESSSDSMVPKPPTFDGSSSVEAWIIQVDVYFKTAKVKDTAAFALLLLREDAFKAGSRRRKKKKEEDGNGDLSSQTTTSWS